MSLQFVWAECPYNCNECADDGHEVMQCTICRASFVLNGLDCGKCPAYCEDCIVKHGKGLECIKCQERTVQLSDGTCQRKLFIIPLAIIFTFTYIFTSTFTWSPWLPKSALFSSCCSMLHLCNSVHLMWHHQVLGLCCWVCCEQPRRMLKWEKTQKLISYASEHEPWFFNVNLFSKNAAMRSSATANHARMLMKMEIMNVWNVMQRTLSVPTNRAASVSAHPMSQRHLQIQMFSITVCCIRLQEPSWAG